MVWCAESFEKSDKYTQYYTQISKDINEERKRKIEENHVTRRSVI